MQPIRGKGDPATVSFRFRLGLIVLLSLATALGMQIRVADASSAITLGASSGTTSQVISVSGSGFGNNSLSLYWDSTNTGALTTVWANGTFSARITIPQAVGGSHNVIAKDGAGNKAQTSFTVIPSVGLQYASGTQGSSNTATAYGYASGESVTFYWNSTSGAALGTVAANTRGTAALTFKVPTSAAGSYTVYAVGTTSAQTSTQFTLTPGLNLSVMSGGPGSATVASGTGFTANQTVSIYWNCGTAPCSGTALATAMADGTGAFSNLTVPLPTSLSPGTYVVGAQSSGTPPAFNSKNFTIQAPSTSVSPTSGPSGTTAKVSGSGFRAGEPVNIYWSCSATPCSGTLLGSATAGSTGAFSGSVTIPNATNGSYTLGSQGASSSLFAGSTFTLKPVLTLSPVKGNAGTSTTVSGSGYLPGETVSIYWNCSAAPCSGTPLSTTTADTSGNITGVSVVIPSVTVGTYPIAAQGAAASNPSFASANFTVTNLAITVSPTAGTLGQTVTVSGTGFANASLNVYWDSTSNGALKSVWANNTFATAINIPQAVGGNHLIVAKDSTGNQAQTTFTVGPSANLLSASGSQGSSNALTVYGFAGNETVNVYWSCSASCTGTPTWTGTTNSAGTAKVSFAVPIDPTGDYTITAIGATSNSQSSATLTLIPALSVSPSSGGPASAVSVSGTGFTAGQTVSLYWNCNIAPCSGSPLASSGTTDANGNFTAVNLALPAPVSPGVYSLGGQDGAATPAFAYKNFTIQAPTIKLSPSTGPAGSSTTVSGSGFQAGESVNIYWNCSTSPCTHDMLGTVVTSSTGTISGSVTIPTGMNAGTYPLAGQGVTSSLFAAATFTARAVISLTRTTGGSGTSVTVTGKGYDPSETVTIYWNCSTSCTGAPLTSQQADGTGALTATITIPSTTYATYPITGVGTDGNVASANFKVLPAVNIAQVGGPPVDLYGIVGVQPGQQAIVSGVSYAANENVDIYWCSGGGVSCTWLTTGTTGSTGSFTGTVTVPSNVPNGTYIVKGVGQISQQAATTSTTVLPVASVTPDNGSAGSTVTIAGQGFGANHWIQIVWNCPVGISCAGQGTIWIDTNSDANGSFTYTGAVIPPNSVVTSTPAPGMYWIRVKDHTFPFQTETWTTFTVH